MQKKMGIRLRHLQTPQEPYRNQNMINIQANHDQGRNRERSHSPLNRRKIFPRPNNQHDNSALYQISEQTIHKKINNDGNKPPISMVSPIMSQPFQSNNNSLLDGNNQYESEVERLIQSLKKKTIELEKKDEIINKIKRQLQLIKAQNSSYAQQIKTLKAQLEFERANTSKNNQIQNIGNQKYNKVVNGQSLSNNLLASTAPNFYLRNNNKQLYNHEPYQQFSMPAQRDQSSNIRANFARNMLQQEEIKPKPNRFDGTQREQDSVLSDYLSPLMVFKAQPVSKPTSSVYSKSEKTHLQQQDNSKTNSRLQYNVPTKFLQQSKFTNNSNGFQPLPSSPFAKKNTKDEYFTQGRSSLGLQNNRKVYDPPSTNIIKEGKWTTLQSSAAHFNTNFADDYHNRNGRINNQNVKKSRKQLEIEDSRQFKFEDFDFSQLDNQMSSSTF